MKTGFAKQLKRAFLLHSQIVWCAVALVKQLLIGAGNRTGPVAFATFFVERAVFLCLHLPSCSPFFLFCLLSSPLLSSPLLSSPSPLLCSALLSPLSLSLSLSLCLEAPRLRPALLAELCTNCRVPHDMASSEGTGALYTMDLFLR